MLNSGSKRKHFAKRFKFRPRTIVLLVLLGFALALAGRIAILRVTEPKLSAFMRADPADPAPIDFVPLAEISPNLLKAVLVSEDNLFFSHSGFDWQSLKAAFAKNVRTQKAVVGGSTLTQQLAKNLFLSREKTWQRKISEAVLTVLMELFLPKERILELYLNYAEMGPGIYGVAAASRYHYNVKPSQLTQTQASLLAATLINGKIYGKKPYPSRTLQRQKRILYRMQHYAIVWPETFKRQPVVADKTDEKNVEQLIQNVTATEAEKPDEVFEEDFSDSPPNGSTSGSAPEPEESPVFLDE